MKWCHTDNTGTFISATAVVTVYALVPMVVLLLAVNDHTWIALTEEGSTLLLLSRRVPSMSNASKRMSLLHLGCTPGE